MVLFSLTHNLIFCYTSKVLLPETFQGLRGTDMAFSPGDFINPDVKDIAHIPVPQAIVNDIFGRLSNGIPVKPKQLANHLPGHLFRPRGQDHAQRNRQWAFALSPRDRFYLETKGRTLNPSWFIRQQQGNLLKRHMLPLSLGQGVVSSTSATTAGTDQLVPLIRNQV